MSLGLVDTTIVLHYFRNNPDTRGWVDSQSLRLSIVSTTWMEVMGAASKICNLSRVMRMLKQCCAMLLSKMPMKSKDGLSWITSL
jgi:hypothetical protein